MSRSTHFIAIATLSLVCSVGTYSLRAEEKNHDGAAAMAAKLGLTEQQTQEIRQICAQHKKKLEPVEEKIWTARREAHAQMSKLLTDEQRAKLPAVMKEAACTEFSMIAAKLGLSEEQRTQVKKTVEEYLPKFHEVAAQPSQENHQQCREIKQQFFEAICKELNDDQRIRLHAVLAMEFKHWTNLSFQKIHVKAVEDQLGLTEQQRSQVEKILTTCNDRIEKPVAQMKEICQEEHAAIGKILTKEEAAKLEEIMKTPASNK